MYLGNGHRTLHNKQVDCICQIAQPAANTRDEFSVDYHPALREAVLLGSLSHIMPERERLARSDNQAVHLAACEAYIVCLVLLQAQVDARSSLYHVVPMT